MRSSAWYFTLLQLEKKTITFFLRFFFRKVKRSKKRFSLGTTQYPCSTPVAVDVARASSTPMYVGDFRQPRQVLHLRRLRRAEEHRLALLRNHATMVRISSSNPMSSMRSASSMQNTLRDPNANPCVFCMWSRQTTGRGDEQIHALDELLRLHASGSHRR